MNRKSILISAVVIAVVVGGALALKATRGANTASSSPVRAVVKSTSAARALPRFVDLGTTTCAPCRVMLGVMEELKQQYAGAMIIQFVNVNEQPAEAQTYGIRVIPTQIFFSPDGRELFRHVGVIRPAEVVAKWEELGYPIAPTVAR